MNVTKDIYSNTALKYNFEVVRLYLCISIFCYFTLPLLDTIGGKYCVFTSLHSFDNFDY